MNLKKLLGFINMITEKQYDALAMLNWKVHDLEKKLKNIKNVF